MTKEQALILWEQLFGDKDVAYDYASHEIHKDDYRNDDNGFGWDVEPKQPLSSGGSTSMSNMAISSMLTKGIRNGKASFRIGNFRYEVRKGRRYGTFEIFDVTDKNAPVSMEPCPGNQNPRYNEARQRKSNEMKKTYSSESDFLSQFFRRNKKETAPVEKPLFQAQEEKESRAVSEPAKEEAAPAFEEPAAEETKTEPKENPIPEEKMTSEESESMDEAIEPRKEENKEEDSLWKFTNEKFAYERPQETFSKENIVEHSKPIDPVTFQDNEAAFVQIKPFEENTWLAVSGKEKAIETPLDVRFVKDAKETEHTLSEENKPEVDGLEKTVSAPFTFEERKEISQMDYDASEKKKEPEPIEERKEEPVEEPKPAPEEKEEPIQKKEPIPEEEKQEDYGYIDVDDDEVVVISENSDVPDQNTDIGDLLRKIDFLKKTVRSLSKEKEENRNRISDFEKGIGQKERENENLAFEKKELQDQLSALETEKNKLAESKNDSDGRLTKLEQEKQEALVRIQYLENELEDSRKKLEDSDLENRNKETQILSLNEIKKTQTDQYTEMTKRLSDVSLSLADFQNRNKDLESDIEMKDAQLSSLKEENETLLKDREGLQGKIAELDQDISSLHQESDELKNNIEKEKRNSMLIKGGVGEPYFDAFLAYMRNNQIYFTQENIAMTLAFNPQWAKREDTSVLYHPKEQKGVEETLEDTTMKARLLEDADVSYLTRDIEREKTAKKLFALVFGADVYETGDFAGRVIRFDDYRNEKSQYGWDFEKLDSDGGLTKDNVVLANLKSLRDFSPEGDFATNGHHFCVVERDGKKVLDSSEFITNPYDYNQAMRVIDSQMTKKKPLVYVFIKFTGVLGDILKKDNRMKFDDLIERTVRRCCPNSYLDTKIIKDYTFLTFDVSCDGAYKEIYRYTILLNSYRTVFKKEKMLNAIIVLDEVEVPLNYRNFTFDQLVNEANDIDLRALKYCFNNTSIIDSMIKRAVHIGPNIIDKLPVKVKDLPESGIGKGNFAAAYSFDKRYYEVPYAYKIK